MKIVINGGGKVGSFLAADMVKNGHQVTLIERRPEVAEKVVIEVPEAIVILGDG
jgi:Trk K+ transport system NAD-binding subunit